MNSQKNLAGCVKAGKNIREVFFRADSGFFSGELFDLLEYYNWNYLVKVKLKNLENLLQSQTWVELIGKNDVAICEFSYKAKGWNRPQMLKAMRTVKEYVQVSYLGQEQIVPVYQYVCYISSYNMDAGGYAKRKTSLRSRNTAALLIGLSQFLQK